jgi:hypothetical protein
MLFCYDTEFSQQYKCDTSHNFCILSRFTSICYINSATYLVYAMSQVCEI